MNEIKQQPDTVNILGIVYKIYREPFGNEDLDGLCDYTSKTIRLRNDNTNQVEDFEWLMKKQLRHELIHAFMAESGLQCNFEHFTQFGHEETTVDWFAIQFPKILKACMETGALSDVYPYFTEVKNENLRQGSQR